MGSTKTIAEGRYLGLYERDHWEFAERTNAEGVVGILATKTFTVSKPLYATMMAAMRTEFSGAAASALRSVWTASGTCE